MPIKMIVTDLDGTLLRNDKTISAYTASVFRRCYDKGLKIVVATARPIRAVVHADFYNRLPVDGAVFHNGALVYAGETCLKKQSISQELAKKIIIFM